MTIITRSTPILTRIKELEEQIADTHRIAAKLLATRYGQDLDTSHAAATKMQALTRGFQDRRKWRFRLNGMLGDASEDRDIAWRARNGLTPTHKIYLLADVIAYHRRRGGLH
jgi:hypothetical protein